LVRAAARAGGATTALASLELEWRILKQLGMRIEPSYARTSAGGTTVPAESFGVSGAVAFGLWHDPEGEVHVQGELLARTPDGTTATVFEPSETELPVAADLLVAVRRGLWTLRATAGAEAGGAYAHAPMHTDCAVLMGILPDERFGFVGLEARADWAREAPFVVAPEFVSDAVSVGVPVRHGVALPVNLGVDAMRASYGMFLRLQWVTGGD
jgi:hypothetical protein